MGKGFLGKGFREGVLREEFLMGRFRRVGGRGIDRGVWELGGEV